MIKEASIVVFPNQLWDVGTMAPLFNAIRQDGGALKSIVVYEDPAFFGDRRGGSFGPNRLRLNKLTLAYRRLTCIEAAKRISATLKARGMGKDITVKHVTVDDALNFVFEADYYAFDPCDLLAIKTFRKRLGAKLEKKLELVLLDSPQFLLPKDVAVAWGREHKEKRLQHRTFYEMVKDRLDILNNVPNQDHANRSPPPKDGLHPPSVYPVVSSKVAKNRLSSWCEAMAWVNHHPIFKDNPGPDGMGTDGPNGNEIGLATTPKEAKEWFNRFIEQRFGLFGKYQDAIVKGEPWLYHSGISIYLNNGLLLPEYVVRTLEMKFGGVPSQLANYEGFLRQVMGWREYTRMYYLTTEPAIARRNSIGCIKTPLSYTGPWYTAKTGIPIVDDAIRDAWKMGYLHHIRRLMVMSNAMTLWSVHPDEVYKWMHEFALDAYEWVMVFNVYSMGTYSDGGRATRKPYVSSTSYLKRMSREKGGAWEQQWNDRYHSFQGK